MRIITKALSVLAMTIALIVGAATIQGASAAVITYTYAANGDYVHTSSGEASAHAWWEWTSVGAPARTAYVSVGLQKYTGGRWVAMAVADGTLAEGSGGTGRRITVKFPCSGTALTSWRTGIYASVNMQPGDAFNLGDDFTTISQRIPCG